MANDKSGKKPAAGSKDDASKSPARRRTVLTGISSRAWEHPADRVR